MSLAPSCASFLKSGEAVETRRADPDRGQKPAVKNGRNGASEATRRRSPFSRSFQFRDDERAGMEALFERTFFDQSFSPEVKQALVRTRFGAPAALRRTDQAAAKGESLGPDLSKIGEKYKRPEILFHIINPSAEVAPENSTYLLVTLSGKVHIGLLVEKTPEKVVIKNASKEVITVPAADIQILQMQEKSMMPDLLLRDMTAQQAVDLLDYLMTLK